jgi:hypothetical protein
MKMLLKMFREKVPNVLGDAVICHFVVCIAVMVCRPVHDRAPARLKMDRFSALGEACSRILACIQLVRIEWIF